MGAPLLLVYNPDASGMRKLRFICAELKILLHTVPLSDYLQPLGALAGMTKRTEELYTEEGFSDSMLVMANFNSQQFHAFLDALRHSGVPAISLKAVLTPTNSAWNSIRLHDALLRERDALRGRA